MPFLYFIGGFEHTINGVDGGQRQNGGPMPSMDEIFTEWKPTISGRRGGKAEKNLGEWHKSHKIMAQKPPKHSTKAHNYGKKPPLCLLLVLTLQMCPRVGQVHERNQPTKGLKWKYNKNGTTMPIRTRGKLAPKIVPGWQNIWKIKK